MTKDTVEDLFAAARVAVPAPPLGLSKRVLADARAHQADAALRVPLRAPSPARAGLWARLRAGLGGGGAIAGMVAATLGGFYIGFAAPVETAFIGAAFGIEMTEIEMMPGLEALLEEAP